MLTAKDHFVAAVSHEASGRPSRLVLGHLELLAESPHLSDELSHQVRVVQRNAVRLRELVADLLLVAEMKDGHLTLTGQPVCTSRTSVIAAGGRGPARRAARRRVAAR